MWWECGALAAAGCGSGMGCWCGQVWSGCGGGCVEWFVGWSTPGCVVVLAGWSAPCWLDSCGLLPCLVVFKRVQVWRYLEWQEVCGLAHAMAVGLLAGWSAP